MEIVFPTSTAPSRNPTETGGRLINAYAEKAPEGSRSKVLYRRSPGLETAFTAGTSTIRGTLLVGTVLYIANGDKVYSVTKSGATYTVTELSGTLGGSGPVIMAHNMASPTEDILIVHSGGMAQIASATVSSFSDPDLPASNSITFMDGYFFVTTADGRCFASGVNATTFDENDFVTAEASPDGLVRAVAFGRDLLLMGQVTTEFYGNAGNATGFPFSRGPVIDVGLTAVHAVAGFDRGFPGSLCWVGNDLVVYRLDGYTHTRISTPHIERLLELVDDTDDLRASVYVAAGHPCWVLKSPDWTFVYDLSTGLWHERKSYQRDNWRAVFSVNAFAEWLVGDDADGTVYRVNETVFTEATDPLIWEVRSIQQHNFPARTAVDRAAFDFVTGVGRDQGTAPIETAPRVSISWSDDGGRTFGNPLLRDLGTQGELVPVDIWRTGLTGRQGRQWKLQCSDPIDISLMGGSMFGEARAA